MFIGVSGPLYVIVEYAPYGNLREFLREQRAVCDGWYDDVEQLQTSLSYKDLLSFAFQVARGLEYMSSQMVNGKAVYWCMTETRKSGNCKVLQLEATRHRASRFGL